MVSAEAKLPSTQVVMEGLYCHNNFLKLLTSHAVVSLALAQRPAVERNHLLVPFLDLREYDAKASVACVCIEDEHGGR